MVEESASDLVDKTVAKKAEYVVESTAGRKVVWKADYSAMMRVAKKDARMAYKWVGAMGVLKAGQMASQLDTKMAVMMVDATV